MWLEAHPRAHPFIVKKGMAKEEVSTLYLLTLGLSMKMCNIICIKIRVYVIVKKKRITYF